MSDVFFFFLAGQSKRVTKMPCLVIGKLTKMVKEKKEKKEKKNSRRRQRLSQRCLNGFWARIVLSFSRAQVFLWIAATIFYSARRREHRRPWENANARKREWEKKKKEESKEKKHTRISILERVYVMIEELLGKWIVISKNNVCQCRLLPISRQSD